MKSIIDQGEYCIFCGKPKEAEHHLIFGFSQRAISENFGLKIPICNEHHNMGDITRRIHGNSMAERLSKMVGQSEWEKDLIEKEGISKSEARDKFIKTFGRNYW